MPDGLPITPPGSAPPMAGAPGPVAAPPEAPSPAPVTPTAPTAGNRARGALRVSLALQLLQKALDDYGVASDEGKDILKGLEKLAGVVGSLPSPTLQQTEARALQDAAPAFPAQSPQQRAAFVQAMRARRMPGMGAAPPGGPAM